MWIQKLILDNFQTYAHVEINLHPHFNCLVGSGNVGKSSLIRALSCILYGTWDNSWVRHEAKFSRITLVTDTGVEVIREKGEGVNKYIVKSTNQPEQVYENFGIQVPTEIETILQVFKVQIDVNEFLHLNVSSQMDPLFLLSKPGSFKAKVLGKLSGAHILDYTLRELNKDKKSLTAEKQLKSIETLDLQKELIKYEGLDHEKSLLDKIGEQITQITRKMEFLQRLKLLFERINEWKAIYSRECDEERVLTEIDVTKGNNLDVQVINLKKLKDLKEKLVKIDNLIEETTKKTEDLQIAEIKKVDEYIDVLQEIKKCPTCLNNVDEQQLDLIRKQL